MKVLSYYNLPQHQNIIFLCKTHPIVDTVPVVVEHVHAVGLQGRGEGRGGQHPPLLRHAPRHASRRREAEAGLKGQLPI